MLVVIARDATATKGEEDVGSLLSFVSIWGFWNDRHSRRRSENKNAY